MDKALQSRIARRLKARRETAGLTQDQLAAAMGFNNRQTLAAVEAGERAIKPAELAMAADTLAVTPDFFTDSFTAAGEAAFSFRAEADPGADVSSFESLAGGWLATYEALGTGEGAASSYLTPSLALTRNSSYEAAQAAAKDVGQRLRLGRVPARDLQFALEREWGILVLYVDAPRGISGAASRLDGLQSIMINRNEPSARRNYDLAHELFHLLTWDAMPPRRIDSERPSSADKRIEELANNFAAALLMPAATLAAGWDASRTLDWHAWMAATALDLEVSLSALRWRLVNLGLADSSELPSEAELRVTAVRPDSGAKPQLFNVALVHRIHTAVESGRLSLRKASRILGLDAAGFAALCSAYGRQLSYEV